MDPKLMFSLPAHFTPHLSQDIGGEKEELNSRSGKDYSIHHYGRVHTDSQRWRDPASKLIKHSLLGRLTRLDSIRMVYIFSHFLSVARILSCKVMQNLLDAHFCWCNEHAGSGGRVG